MASQEDDNKLECIAKVNKQQERYFLNVYKKHEYILNSKSETFENKIESLIDVWKSIGELNLSEFDLHHVIQIMDWAKLHALNIVLTAEWNIFKASRQSKLLEKIEKAQHELLKLNSAFATRCKKLADVVKNPWEDPILMKLMKTKDAEISTEEIEFFCVETAYLISVRLKKLCESHCEDLALNLVTAFMNCNKLSKSQNFSLNATETQMWFMFDIYIALLYKFQDKQKIVVLLKELTFDEGLQLVKRFAKKRVKISKIWKNCQRIAILAVQLYISQAVVKYTEELKAYLEIYIEIYISLCTNESLFQDFSTSIRRISNLADAAGLYIFCSVIQKKAGAQLKPLVIEMYIRALTTDMNELERQKDANETEKVAATTSRLAEAFCNLADFLDEHVKVARECVLTAFSLEPTKQRLQNIETLARRSGFQVLDTGQEWKCKLHPPTLPSDEISWVCPECGEWMSKPDFNVPIKINMALNEALQNSVLGISESLCDDLVVCLSNPRYQILSWFLPWQDLHRLCLMYLQDPQATKNIVTELKFVDIDYSIFKGIKREPLDELDGIERGYEQYLDQDFVSDEETTSISEDSMSQDSRPYSLGSDGAGEGPFFPMLPAQAKSDPNTLKSLRMFRHNLKRSKDKEACEGTPEKLFKRESSVSVEPVSEIPVPNQLISVGTSNIAAAQYPAMSSCVSTSDKDFHSKNVKTATLPLLGGQVAKKEKSIIQVSHQPNSLQHLVKEFPVLRVQLTRQVLKQKTISKELRIKLQNKCLLNGLKENNNCNISKNLMQESRLPPQDLQTLIPKESTPVVERINEVQLPPSSLPHQLEKSQPTKTCYKNGLIKTPILNKPKHRIQQEPTNSITTRHPQICKSLKINLAQNNACYQWVGQKLIENTRVSRMTKLECSNINLHKRTNTDKLKFSQDLLQTQCKIEQKQVRFSLNAHRVITQEKLLNFSYQCLSNRHNSQSKQPPKSNNHRLDKVLQIPLKRIPKRSLQILLKRMNFKKEMAKRQLESYCKKETKQTHPIKKVLSIPTSILTLSQNHTFQITNHQNPDQEEFLPLNYSNHKYQQEQLLNLSNTLMETTKDSIQSSNQELHNNMGNTESLIRYKEVSLSHRDLGIKQSSSKGKRASNTQTNKKLLHNNSYNSLTAPSHCPNFAKSLISQSKLASRPTVRYSKLRIDSQIMSVNREIIGDTRVTFSRQSVITSTSTQSETSMLDLKACSEITSLNRDSVLDTETTINKEQLLHQFNKVWNFRESPTWEDRLESQTMIFCNSSNITKVNETDCNKNDVPMCNNESNCKTSGDIIYDSMKSNDENINSNTNNVDNFNFMECAQFDSSEYELFSDVFQSHQYDVFVEDIQYLQNHTLRNESFKNDSEEILPKNSNLTENIRTYIKKPKKTLLEDYKDCVKTLTGVNVLDVCRNVNIINSTENLHSNVQKPPTKPKELKVFLCRLNRKLDGKCITNKEEIHSIKKCDRGKFPPKYSRRRKSLDKSENKLVKAPNLVQNHNLSPLSDVNPRVNSLIKTKTCCKKAILFGDVKAENGGNANKKSNFKSIFLNVPGLNDFEMIKPTCDPQVVNVVQVSGGRPTQTVSIQNSQTSTQVTPHIQRIGQPRVVEQKTEHSNSVTSTTQTSSATTPTTRTISSTQPSTLINILSQQIVRPAGNATNTVRRQGPLINILSQQIIRPSNATKTVVQSTANNTPTTTEPNLVKVAVTTEQTVLNNSAKPTNALVKNTNTVTPGQGGTILQFICKSSLPKFQQAFGKTVYQNNAEAVDPPTTTAEVTNNTSPEAKKTVASKTVPVNLQPIPGSVIYSRQLPAGQAISLLPPGTATTRQVFRIATSNAEQLGLVKDTVIHSKMSALLAAALQGRPKNADGEIVLNSDEIKGTVVRPTLVQGARIVKPVQLQMATNVVKANPQQPNLSSTTLEQLREFDMVYKQIKERSTTSISETCTTAEGQEGVPQRISVTYVNQLQKYTQLSPVVVVTTYSSLQPAASPALSVTSQGSSSPCVTPASTPTLPKLATKNSKGKTIKTTTTNNSQAKSSPIPKPQQKPQEDEHTTQRIFDILAEYAEQLRNSPDLNNKPAPRRRSNPPTNPSQNSKRKKSSSGVKKSGQGSGNLDMDTDDMTIGSEDSSGGGVVQLSVTDDEQSQASTSVNTTESSSENPSPPSTRPVILAEGGSCANQSRNLIIADSSVGEALKIPNTAVIVPGSYIMPVSMMKGGQQIAVVSGGSKILATVPARSGQNMLLFQSFTNQNRKAISAVKYSTIQPITGMSTQTLAGVSQQPVLLPTNVALGQPLTLKRIGDDRENSELLLTISQPKEEPKDNEAPQPDSSTSLPAEIKIEDIKIEDQSDNSNEKVFQTYQKSVINSVETSVIATVTPISKAQSGASSQTIVTPSSNAKAEIKGNERIQSVLVTAGSSNGPMLSHTNARYRKVTDKSNTEIANKVDFMHNGEKPNKEQKNFKGNATYYVNKAKKIATESQKLDSEMQKQAAIERELRLHKSLSEECEDLGVDEPSTSDLFPEADLLFDSNHSPSFDQTSQDIIKRVNQVVEIKEEVKESMNLFSDDDNSSSLRGDLFEYVEYQPVKSALDYQGRQINGNNIEAGSSGCEDNTLLPKCAAMSEVTLNSPISPEMYQENTMHKYKFKYSNRKKGERIKQNEYCGEVVSSSEDTIVCNELGKVNCEESYKVVHIAKQDLGKEGKCELHCEDDIDSPSGRGARRSVRKLCSCCNGAQDGNIAKKRPHTSRPHTPATPHKKAFLSKKR